MDIWMTHFVNGISFGLLLFLIAAGLSLIMGVMGILNLAHGALYMVGAYIGVTVAGRGGNFWLAALAGAMAAGLVGLAIERLFLRYLHKQFNEQCLLTIGVLYVLTNVALWIWGPWPRMVTPPVLLSGSLDFGEFSYPVYRLALIIIGLVVAVGLYWVQEKTRVGAIIRAGMEDKEMTVGLGIDYGLVSCVAFFLGAFLAGFAGFVGAPIVGAYLQAGWPMFTLAMIVIVVGGMGSVQGALLGGIVMGLIDNLTKAVVPDLALVATYTALVIMLLIRPSGLLGREQF